jgi:YVTN family beta-propeller protein
MKRTAWIAIAALAMFVVTLSVVAAGNTYHFIKEIKIGGEGGWDYLSVDAKGRRLFVTHATKVVVIDLDKDAVVGEVTETPGVHGFVAVPDLGKGFSSNGQEGKSSVVDLKSLKTLSKVETGANPDAILYEPKNQEIYTFNGRGQSATVFSARTGTVSATIPLGGKPETGVADPAVNRVYVNNEDKHLVVVIDTKTHKVVAEWPIAPGMTATGMAFDVKNHRLFIGCSNRMIVIMDSTNGKVIQTLPTGPGVDAAAFDPATGLAFASAGGDGTVTIVKADKDGKYSAVQTLQTARFARTMTLDPKTHNIYLSAQDFQPAPEPQPGQRAARGAAIPGSFKVLVYGIAK